MGDSPFYVYELIDPRDGAVFYVGKGVRGRVHHHERDAKKGATGPKCDRIREILDSGASVTHRIVRRFSVEADAYAFEASHIDALGIQNLTNISLGGGGGVGCGYSIAEDMGLARDLAKLQRQTANFTWFPAFARLGETLYPIGACAILSIALIHAKLVARRGVEWVNKHADGRATNNVSAAKA